MIWRVRVGSEGEQPNPYADLELERFVVFVMIVIPPPDPLRRVFQDVVEGYRPWNAVHAVVCMLPKCCLSAKAFGAAILNMPVQASQWRCHGNRACLHDVKKIAGITEVLEYLDESFGCEDAHGGVWGGQGDRGRRF